jgi:hypothetical protein
MNARALVCVILASLSLLGAPVVTAAPLQNGDFASWNGWSAEITEETTPNTFVTTAVDPASDAHFTQMGGGIAQLANDASYFEAVLFQAFDLPVGAATLSFDYAWSITDADFDVVQADLRDSGDNLHDLFPLAVDVFQLTNSGTATTDISALAGQAVTIEFILQDGDFNEADTFQVGNIAIAVVPEPASGGLLLLPLAAMAARHHRRRV